MAPVFALVALAYIVYANWSDVVVGRPSLIASAAMMAAAAIHVIWARRRGGVSTALTAGGPAGTPP